MKKLLSFGLFVSINKLSSVHMQGQQFTNPGKLDEYNCFHFNSSNLKDEAEFRYNLHKTLAECIESKRKAIWVKLPVDQIKFADILIKAGFKMHHCNEKYITFSQWLIYGEKSRLPHQSSHNVGAGGLLLNNNKILLVQEKNGRKRGIWGLPSGLTDKGEYVYQTAIREVKEETGLDVEAKDIFAIRETTQQDNLFGDMYFVVLVEMKDKQQEVKMCEKELMNYEWVDLAQVDQFVEKHRIGFMLSQLLKEIIRHNQSTNHVQRINFQSGIAKLRGQDYGYTIYKPNL